MYLLAYFTLPDAQRDFGPFDALDEAHLAEQTSCQMG